MDKELGPDSINKTAQSNEYKEYVMKEVKKKVSELVPEKVKKEVLPAAISKGLQKIDIRTAGNTNPS